MKVLDTVRSLRNIKNKMLHKGRTSLHLAAEEGRKKVVRGLLKFGADVDVRDEWGLTPLCWAAGRGYRDTMRVLLANKASVDVRDRGGGTPLYWAAERGDTDTVAVLLANKASVDVHDRVRGNTPLHRASEGGHTEVVELLCRESGCDVNTVNKIGDTPLHGACKYGHLDIVNLLVEEHADVTVVNKYEETAYDVCGCEGNVDESTVENIKEFLKEHFKLESDAPPTATIDGTAGGVMRYKEVQIRVPPNAIFGDINIEFVDQSLSAREVHDKTKGRAILHRQVICVASIDENATFSEPVEIRVPLKTMFEKVNDQRIDSEAFRILHEKDGEVTDITEDCNFRLRWEEIAFYCKTCSMVNIVWLADFTSPIPAAVFSTIKSILEASYMCKICPYIKDRQDGGLIALLFCHGVDVERTDDIEHECTSYKMRLINSATLSFEVDCWSIKDDEKKQIYSRGFKLARDHCDRACTVFSMISTGVRALDKVQLCVKELIYKETLMDRSVKVHEESNTTGKRRGTGKLHQQVLLEVAERVIGGDFEKLKELCEEWIKPAILQNITNTRELLELLQRQEIINVGDYSELTRLLHQLHLEELAELVEKLSSEIKGPVSAPKARAPKTHYEVDIFQKHDDLFEKPVNRPRSPIDERENAIINGTTGGVIRWKEVEFRVPSNAVCGHIHVEIIDQPLLVQAVIDNTNGRATLHRQRICVTCADEDVIFSEPVEVRVTVRTMLGGLYLQQLDREGFRILREKNGEVTDVSEECNVRLHGDEIFFSCKTFSILHTAWVAAAKLLRPLKNIIFTSYTCKLCPSIEGEPHGGLTIMVFCHGIDVTCSANLQHECIRESWCLTDKASLIFEVECLGSKSKEMELISHEFELDRDRCESTGTSFGESKPGVKPLVADKVNVKLRVSNYPKPLLDRPEKVHVHEVSAVGTAPAIPTTSNTTEIRTCPKELHQQLLLMVADSVVEEDFGRLKGLCNAWINRAKLDKITNTGELLDQLEEQGIIKVGEYSKLIYSLDLLDLNKVKDRVEQLSREIVALGVDH